MVANVSPAAERLGRILQTERSRGCQNTVVMGGLDALLRNLLAQFPDEDAPVFNVAVTLHGRGYADLSVEQRRAWLDRALVILSGQRSMPSTPVPTRGADDSEPRRPIPIRGEGSSVDGTTRTLASPVVPVSLPPRRVPDTTPRPIAAGRPASIRPLPTGASPSPRAARRPAKPLELDMAVTSVPGIGSGRAEVLAKLGITTVRDLLYHFPHRHDDYSRVVPISGLQVGEQQTVVANVWSAQEVQIGRAPRKSTELIVGDETGNMQVMFFNNPYPARGLRTNQRVTLSGKVSVFRDMRQMQNPEWEVIDEGSDLDKAIHTGRLVPVYPLTHGLLNRSLRQYIRAAVDACANQLEDPLPEAVRTAHGYPELAAAIRQVHYPDSAEALEEARRRLAYEELLTLQLSVLARRVQRASSLRTSGLPLPPELGGAFVNSLPFSLTAAQTKVSEAILADLGKETPMVRLLQGDVGSGKTVVAATALLAATANRFQSVLMAPTEILAEQHFRTLCSLFGGDLDAGRAVVDCRPAWWDRPIRIALLRGSLRARAKRDVQESIALGLVDVAVGTQALIQGGVTFTRLGLTIVDEQHRFGVAQRSALAEKGDNSHLLVMTATPIPRTLALSVYGDLDLSVIDEMPEGRKPVRTRIIESQRRDYAYRFVRDQIELGFQAFVICPLVEESESLEVRAATEEYERLRLEVFPDLQVSLLHGRMPPAEKDAVMQDFRDRRTQILVSTAVVEVGIDIPMATVIMIEGAERFGLAQLHQFRGRVGRGGQQSFCLLLSDSASEESLKRLELLEKTNDGLQLAEFDLQMRGPGDYFGTRQSGLPALRQARITDTPILEQARADAATMLERDPRLDLEGHAALKRRVEHLAKHAGEAN